MDEVFLVVKQKLGELHCVVELSLSDEGEGGYDGDSSLPQDGTFDQAIEQSPWIVLGFDFLEGRAAGIEILSDDVRSGEVHQVPVIDVSYAVQVKLVHILLILCLFELMVHHN